MEKRRLGEKINAARKDRGITADTLAGLCGINATYLRQIESGAKVPSLPVFVSICNELRTSPSYMLQDSMVHPECSEMDEMFKLWFCASPKQIKLITAIVRSALGTIQEFE